MTIQHTASRAGDGHVSFIPTAEIERLLADTRPPEPSFIREILAKARGKQRLELRETAALIRIQDPEQTAAIFDTARALKQAVYGNRIVLFAPLYIGNDCINDCAYCGFRSSNPAVERATLSPELLTGEVDALLAKGHKRLILVFGEHPRYSPDYIADTVRQVYARRVGNGNIRRVNINAAPMAVEGYKKVKAAGIGTYQIFQETYHEPTYRAVHPRGPKSDFLWRLYGLDRAMEAGVDDVGIGALMGLHDWRFEVLGLLSHTLHLEERFGVGPHTISFPRIEPAVGTVFADRPPQRVADADFKKLVAILRLAVPYTGLILTCRESVALRNEMLEFGVSQIDGGSNIGIGAYAAEAGNDAFVRSQFKLGDQRTLDEVIAELCRANMIPSFCTSCYRMGRTGQHFMEFAVPGFVKQFCTPNAVLTFLEYLMDYAGPETREAGLAQIDRELARIPAGAPKDRLLAAMARIRAGERDLCY